MDHHQCFFQRHSIVYLFLSNASERCAELSKFRVDSWFNIGLEYILDSFVFDINDDYWELYDFIESEVFSAFLALALKVIDTNVVKGSFINVLFLF